MGSKSLQKEADLRRVYHFMTKKVITISRKENLLHAAKKMARYNISCLVVTERKKPVGIVTERDYMKKVVLEEKKPHDFLVEEIMTPGIRFLPEESDVISAYKLMKKYHIRRFPVIDRKGHLIGLLTQHDILEAMSYIIQHLDWKLVRAKIAFADLQDHLEKADVI